LTSRSRTTTRSTRIRQSSSRRAGEATAIARQWLEQISVRRPWRRRGLAAALILSACAGLRERSMTEVALGVDSTSPTGAFELYERLGFQILRRITTWRRALGRKA
jgi:mycothiol synthase